MDDCNEDNSLDMVGKRFDSAVGVSGGVSGGEIDVAEGKEVRVDCWDAQGRKADARQPAGQ